MAREAHVGTLVLGDIRRDRDSLAIEVKVHDVRSGDRIETRSVRAAPDADPRPLFDRCGADPGDERRTARRAAVRGRAKRPPRSRRIAPISSARRRCNGFESRYGEDTCCAPSPSIPGSRSPTSGFATWKDGRRRYRPAPSTRCANGCSPPSGIAPAAAAHAPPIRIPPRVHGSQPAPRPPDRRRTHCARLHRRRGVVPTREAHFHDNSGKFPTPTVWKHRACPPRLPTRAGPRLGVHPRLPASSDALKACAGPFPWVCAADSATTARRRAAPPFRAATIARVRAEASQAEIATARGWTRRADDRPARGSLLYLLYKQRMLDDALGETDALARTGAVAQAGIWRARILFDQGRLATPPRYRQRIARRPTLAVTIGSESIFMPPTLLAGGGGRLDPPCG